MHITRQTRVIVVTAAVLMLACDNSVMAACDPCGCPSCPTLGSGGPITGRISPLYTTETQCCQNPPDIAGLSGAARAEKWANRLHITISDVGDTDTLTRYAWNPNRGQNCACAQVAQTTETRGDTVAIEWSGDVDLAVPDHYTLKATLSNNTTATEHIACDDGTYMDCDVSVPDGSLELVSNVYVQWLKCSCTRLSNMESETSEPKSVFEDGWLYDQESSGVVTTQYKWEYVTGFTSPCGQQVQMGLQAQVGRTFRSGSQCQASTSSTSPPMPLALSEQLKTAAQMSAISHDYVSTSFGKR